MSAPLDDLMGNELTEHVIVNEPDEEIEISVVDDRPEEDRVEPRSSDTSDDDSEIEVVGLGNGHNSKLILNSRGGCKRINGLATIRR